ncbi:uncharacterized protein LOC141685834 [Apium graveolens]|uniref:uncharacterized protein LOC141685834 n=1 Tax=Apium graveolens TaxID=4045 RepID=UPI003D7B18FF
MEYEKIHVCPNDCLLYRGEINEDETSCHICQASRWKKNKNGDEIEGIPAKIERVKDNKFRHPADSKIWKEVDEKWPEFASDSRNLRMALSSDGFNPFHGKGTDHSSWPVLLSIYNLPPWLCMKRKYIMLCLLISGPTQPVNDIDVFLQPLIEDLQKLWHGKQVYDAYKRESFVLRGILLWTISDYPALGSLSGNIVKGYNGCVVCVDQTKATRLPNYRKTVVMRHRRWLTRDHPYRKQKAAFDNTIEKGSAPIPLTGEEVFQQVQYLQGYVYGKTQRKPGRWIYSFERYMKIFKGYIRNRARAEGYIAEAYIAEEAVECLINFEESTVRVPENGRCTKDAICRPLSGATMITPSTKDLHLAHLCVLQNSTDVVPYFDEHLSFLMDQFPERGNDEIWLKKKQNETFPKWFKEKIASNLLDGEEVPQHIRWVADGPNNDVPTFSGYKVHGVTFSTKSRDDARQVQCSGVCVDVDTMVVQGTDKNIQHTSHTYYGVLNFIWELDYNSFRIPFFLCNWVDMNRGIKVDELGYTLVNLNRPGFFNDPFVLATHVKQVCYIDDPLEKLWSVVLKFPERKHYDDSEDENEGSVEVELESEFFMPNLPDDDFDDDASYIRDVDEQIQLD